MPPPSPESAQTAPRGMTLLRVFLVTLLAYIGTGLVALQLAIPPGYAAPLYPPAGIALAAVLVYCVRLAPAAALGAFICNLTLTQQRGNLELSALGLPA